MRHLYTLQYNKESIGVHYQDACYILCFPYGKHAMTARNVMNPVKQNIFLTKYHNYPILEVTHKELDTPSTDTTIDLYSSKGHFLHIGKDTPGVYSRCTLYENPFEEVLMYPIFNNVGLILTKELMDETEKELVFSTELVKPLNNPKLFKHILP